MKKFVNRFSELSRLRRTDAGLIVVFGRRRVGKTALIERWGESRKLKYTQAIEGAESIQVSQILGDLKEILPQGLTAQSWVELFALLSLVKEECIIAIDEFPYLVKSQPSLPSRLQKWLDHDRPPHVRVVILGSSQTMMNSLFLSSTSPLYERADLILHLHPMGYRYFCEALELDPLDKESFYIFSLVGGVPRYWSYIRKGDSPIQVAELLYFSRSAVMEWEPDRLLRDEDVNGAQAKSIFECIGRGAHKSSVIAARMGLPQTALSKPLQLLMHASLIQRSLPFGESPRSSKKTFYSISDCALSFWYRSYSPHRSRWYLYDEEKKNKIIRDHAALVLEECFRGKFPDAARYWEGQDLEFDCVRHSAKDGHIVISEIKLRELSREDMQSIEGDIHQKFLKSKLAGQYQLDRIEVLGGPQALEKVADESDLMPMT